MLRLFEQACREVLSRPPEARRARLVGSRPLARRLLEPVVAHFEGQIVADWEVALAWCRDYAVRVTEQG